MADPGTIRPDQYEILATRTLRAAGESIDHPHVLECEGPERDSSEYTLRLDTMMHRAAAEARLLLECRRNDEPIDAGDLEALTHRFPSSRIVVFATGGFDATALIRAADLGMVLFRVVDAKAKFAQWGYAGHVPAWMPEFSAERAGGVSLPA
jgi:hypothetical protein